MQAHLGAVFVGLLLGSAGLSQDAATLFIRMVEPALRQNCFGCHGEGQTLGKLDLRTREAMLRGGTRGPSLVPHNAADSRLYQAVIGQNGLQMPPGDASKRLPTDMASAIRRWIEEGAPWPAPETTRQWNAYREEDLWAFRPVRQTFSQAAIDGFVNEKLRERGFASAPAADRRTLIRRATIDLIGLPPSPEEIAAFIQDRAPGAWPRLVDRLLASPRYGERWGRHWLDVVRYADSGGYSNDFERPNAWRYRDYVIRAFNNDVPYDRFVREQIAGDELYPGNPEALIATGFLRAGPWEHTAMSVEAVTRQMFLDDVTSAVGVTFLGITVGCARCHDHKFDPIPTKDYYRMQATFASTEFVRPAVPFLPVENVERLGESKARMEGIARRTQAEMDSFDPLIREMLMKRHGVTKAGDLPPKELADALRTKELLNPEQYEHYKLYQKHLQLHKESLDRYAPKAFAVSSGPIDGVGDGGPALRYPARANYVPATVRILPGGNVQSPGEAVAPGVPGLVEHYAGIPSPNVPVTVQGRRAALASWITRPDHPLTARVMVNRIWQYHFGKGLAADANNFGKSGKKPTHPELLDWLAAEFVRSGWSVKALHRRILLSETYRRSGQHPNRKELAVEDPGDDLLAFYPARRVEAEVIRDAALLVAGELSLDAGGPGTFPQINEDVARQPLHRMGSLAPAYQPSPTKRDRNRRTIYTFQQRSLVDPLVEVFNGPNMDLSCDRRESSTVPTQAFALLNSRFMNDIALAFAARLQHETANPRERVVRAFLLAYGRRPATQEVDLALRHVARQTAYHQAHPPPPKETPKPLIHMITSELTGERFQFAQMLDSEPFESNLHPSQVGPSTRAWADFALVLLNSNEFVYVD